MEIWGEIWAAKADVMAGACSSPSSETCRCHSRPKRLAIPSACETRSTSSAHRCVWDDPTGYWCLWWKSLILFGSSPHPPFVLLPSLVRSRYLRNSGRVERYQYETLGDQWYQTHLFVSVGVDIRTTAIVIIPLSLLERLSDFLSQYSPSFAFLLLP